MSDPLPRSWELATQTPKYMDLPRNVKSDLKQWLYGQASDSYHTAKQILEKRDEGTAKRGEPPHGFLERLARKFTSNPTEELNHELLSKQQRFQMIKDADHDLSSGRVDRMEYLLVTELEDLQQYIQRRRFDETSLERNRSQSDIALLKYINPERAQEFSNLLGGIKLIHEQGLEL